MKLVICEKRIAAQRLATILSNGKMKNVPVGKTPVYHFTRDGESWDVIGLKGHIITLDYPAGFNQWTKIPPEQLITVEPVKKIHEKGIANALGELVKQNPSIIVATDYDREGELIGVEAIELINKSNEKTLNIKRARFSAITLSEINRSFNNLVEVDYNLSNAAEARQIIDLVWGAVLTRFISITSQRLGRNFLSMGRVQSPTLQLLVDREKEIKSFIPKSFWLLLAKLKKNTTFEVQHLEGKFWDEERALAIHEIIKDEKLATVSEIIKTQQTEYPPSPFNTTSFLQAASYLGFSAAKAMSLAEELYMKGLTSYPRTDNTVYPSSLNIKGILQKLSQSSFAQEANEVLTNGRPYPTRGKMQTTDHPPIYPVDIPSGKKKLTTDQNKIYELICRRFLATLAKDALSETTKAIFDIGGEQFSAEGYTLIEPNWRAIYTYIKQTKKAIPDLVQGEHIEVVKISITEDATKPPSRYTQGALIAKMEELSLGTKSTRHEIIAKLYSRKYVASSPPIPTQTAFAVVEAFAHCDVVKPSMTATLEKDMNEIAEGRKTLEETVSESREMLTNVMKNLLIEKESIKTNIKKALREQNRIGACPKCGKDLVVRVSKKGKRFIGCVGYPECNNTYSLPQKGGLAVTKELCDACNSPIVRIFLKGKYGWNLCVNPDCPKKKKNNTNNSDNSNNNTEKLEQPINKAANL